MHAAPDRTGSPVAPVRVLYIAGWLHNGSTLAGSILGGADGVFFAGEVRNVCSNLLKGARCSCEASVSDCPLWSRIVEGVDIERTVALERRLTRMRDLPRIQAALRGHGPLAADMRELIATLGRLYRSIADETGCRLIADSSKSPLYARLLTRVPGIELSALQIVRDPRGWCWSSLKDGRDAEVGTVQGSILWDLSQLYGETWARRPRCRRVRYEDFIRRPQETLASALETAGLPGLGLPFTSSGDVLIEPGHIAAGNRNRFRTGPLAIRLDEEWRERLPRRDFAAVTALTWPLLLRYGYSPRRRRTASTGTASEPTTNRSAG